MQGTKRQRETMDEATAQHIIHLELIGGLTRRHAEVIESRRRTAHEQLTSSNDISALLRRETGFLFDGTQVICQALLPAAVLRGEQAVTTPSFIDTVQLIAEDGEVVVLKATSSSDAFRTVRVRRDIGEQLYAGDVVLFTPALCTDAPLYEARLLTFDPRGAFAGVDAATMWAETAASNMVAVVRWTGQLLTQPPGLAQLSYLLAARLTSPHEPGSLGSSGAWTRSLQLPLLLVSLDSSTRVTLPPGVVRRLRQTIRALLRLYVDLFSHAETLMPTATLFDALLFDFVASPLFVDGLPELALLHSGEAATSDTADERGNILADALELVVEHVCRGQTARRHPWRADLSQRAQDALHGVELLLSRLSTIWLAERPRRHDSATADAAVLATVVRRGSLLTVVQWLQERERVGGGGGGTNVVNSMGAKTTACLDEDDQITRTMSTPLLERLHLPPTLDDVGQLCEDKGMSVGAQLAVMQRTYSPRLSRDAPRFLDAAVLAAYAELYGPCLRCAAELARRGPALTQCDNVSTMKDAPESDASRVGVTEDATSADGCIVRLHSVTQPRAQETGALAHLSMSALRHEGEFGPAVKLRVAVDTPRKTGASVDTFVRILTRHGVYNGYSSEQYGASVFGYVVVHLQGKAVAFPVVLTGVQDEVGTVDVTAHVLRDADMLGDFVRLSAALEAYDGDGVPHAWLVVAHQARPGSDADDEEATTALVPTRLLPSNTPALTYIDLIHRLLSVRTTLVRDQASVTLHDCGTRSATRSLWMHYFGTGTVPRQPTQWLHALTPTARRLQTGGGGEGEYGLQTAIRDITTAAASLTHAQVEALHELCTPDAQSISLAEDAHAMQRDAAPASLTPALGGSTATATINSSSSVAPVLPLRVVEGVSGTGRTGLLYAAGLVRGRLHSAVRKAQQADLSSALKESGAGVRELAQRAREASTMRDLFSAFGGSATCDAAAETGEAMTGHALRDMSTSEWQGNGEVEKDTDEKSGLLERLVRTAMAQTRLHTRLVRGLQHCATPLLLRADAATAMQRHMPASVHKLLFAATPLARGESAVLATSELTSLPALLREGYERSQRAPAVRQCSAMLDYLRSLGDAEARLARSTEADTEDENHGPLYVPLLPLFLSARDIHDTIAAAATSETWSYFLQTQLWPEDDLAEALPRPDEADDDAATSWPMPSPIVEAHGGATQTGDTTGFHTVMMPETMRLSRLRGAQARGWFVVFAEKQRALLSRLRAWLHRTRQATLAYIYDITLAVTATLQSTRYSLLTTTSAELMGGTCWPLLWRWQPAALLVDDVDVLGDVILALLPAACHSVTLSLTTEAPPSREVGAGLAMSVLHELRRDLQRVGVGNTAGALTTTVLRESLRCSRAEVRSLLARLVRSHAEDAETRQRDDVRDTAGVVAGPDVASTPHSAEEDDDDGRGGLASDGQEPTTGLCGLASCSTVEMWTHAVPLSVCLRADYRAARFLQAYWASYGEMRRVALFTGSAADGLVLRAMQSAGGESGPETAAPWSTAVSLPPLPICLVPLAATRTMGGALGEVDGSGWDGDEDGEIDVALVSLSGLAVRLLGKGEDVSARATVREVRTRWWNELQRCNDHGLERRLVHWLWRILSRVRHGVVLIGPSELCEALRVLRRVMHFVLRQRISRAPPATPLAYWLPSSEVHCAVLGLQCPSHYRCRRIALITSGHDHTGGGVCTGPDGETGVQAGAERPVTEDEVVVRLSGAMTCHSLCLQNYDGCDRNAHVCLHECHIMALDTGATASHALCPYPCCKTLPCGHVCHRPCGETCAPCEFVGLQEMSCGQRVISGVSEAARQGDTSGGAKMAEYACFAHFQTRPCGTAPRPCSERVSVMCPRCGTRSFLACHVVTVHEARVRGNAASGTEESAAGPDFVLGDAVCPGCVQVYNTVARKYGYATLAVPCAALDVVSHGTAALNKDVETALHASLPRTALSPDALAELRQAFVLAGKKTQLLVMKEALEISSGRAAARSDFVVYKTRYVAQKAERAAQEASWRDGLDALVERWTQRLRGAVEAQVGVNAELETLLPLLRSEAEAEAQRQRAHVLV